MEYSSQYGQDRFIDEHVMRRKANGVFVEIGAYDGVTFSNTVAFERYRHWAGICIEPLPDQFKALEKNREAKCYQVCLSDKPGTVEFDVVRTEADGGMLSGMRDAVSDEHADRIRRVDGNVTSIKVQAVTFGSILERSPIGRIDYISLDTEGHELAILRTIDLGNFKPTCLTVEENGQFFAIRRYVGRWGYRIAEKLGPDLVIVSRPAASQMKGIGLLHPVTRFKRYSAAALRRLRLSR